MERVRPALMAFLQGGVPAPLQPETTSAAHVTEGPAPLLAAHRLLTIDAPEASDSGATESSFPSHPNVVSRAFVTAGRQIAGAFKLTGGAIRAAF
mgnify:CR=1 FL=1